MDTEKKLLEIIQRLINQKRYIANNFTILKQEVEFSGSTAQQCLDNVILNDPIKYFISDSGISVVDMKDDKLIEHIPLNPSKPTVNIR